jgi:hypothetical protein
MRYYERELPARYGRDEPSPTHHDGRLVLLPPRQPGWVCDLDPRHAEPTDTTDDSCAMRVAHRQAAVQPLT